MEYFDNIGNKIEIGDRILILIPKSGKTYCQGVIKNFKNICSHGPNHFHCEVLVEYDDGRLYCNEYKWNQRQGHNIKFNKKTIKVWRSNSDIVKLKPEYIQ